MLIPACMYMCVFMCYSFCLYLFLNFFCWFLIDLCQIFYGLAFSVGYKFFLKKRNYVGLISVLILFIFKGYNFDHLILCPFFFHFH
jgi:hypothetical protein